MATHIGPNVVFGVPEQMKPVVCDIPERTAIKLRFRQGYYARAFVRSSSGIREFILDDHGDTWHICAKYEQGRNIRCSP